MLRPAAASSGAPRANLRYREAMLPGPRRRLTMPVFASLLLLTGAISGALALAPLAVEAGVTAGRAMEQLSSGRSMMVDGITIGIPNPGVGVGASETHPDGTTT